MPQPRLRIAFVSQALPEKTSKNQRRLSISAVGAAGTCAQSVKRAESFKCLRGERERGNFPGEPHPSFVPLKTAPLEHKAGAAVAVGATGSAGRAPPSLDLHMC